MTVELDANERKIVDCVCHVVRVDRLKAVKVFKGFTRLGGKETVPPDVIGKSDWLPAMELYGEASSSRSMRTGSRTGSKHLRLFRDWIDYFPDLTNPVAIPPIH